MLTCSCEGGDRSQREGSVESARQRGGRGLACPVALLADEQLRQVGGRRGDEGRRSRRRCRQQGRAITIVQLRRTARQIPATDQEQSRSSAEYKSAFKIIHLLKHDYFGKHLTADQNSVI